MDIKKAVAERFGFYLSKEIKTRYKFRKITKLSRQTINQIYFAEGFSSAKTLELVFKTFNVTPKEFFKDDVFKFIPEID